MLRVNFEVTKTPTHLEQIDEVVIVNTGRTLADGSVPYVVKHNGDRVGDVLHKPGDGALVLTRLAIALILEGGG